MHKSVKPSRGWATAAMATCQVLLKRLSVCSTNPCQVSNIIPLTRLSHQDSINENWFSTFLRAHRSEKDETHHSIFIFALLINHMHVEHPSTCWAVSQNSIRPRSSQFDSICSHIFCSFSCPRYFTVMLEMNGFLHNERTLGRQSTWLFSSFVVQHFSIINFHPFFRLSCNKLF